MFLPRKNIIFEFIENTCLNRYDTTSYFFQIGTFRTLLGQQDLSFLLSGLGNYSQITNSVIEDTKEFIRVAFYNGNKSIIFKYSFSGEFFNWHIF